MLAKHAFRQDVARRVSLERLESRICLAGDAPCLLEASPDGDAARATQAVNCFAFDLYEHFQQQQGNLFLSPLSISTGLAMAYAGAAGQTAAEMEQVLHLGTEPGVPSSFAELLSSLEEPAGVAEGYELELANAMWPQIGLPIHDEFVNTIQTDYRGEAQSLDYSKPDQARDIINAWVEEKTQGKIQDLIDELDPATVMVLTNSIYFKSFWANPFDPRYTDVGQFQRDDGEVVEATMMLGQPVVPFTEVDGFQVLEMPFEGEATSMIFVLPPDQVGSNELTPELLGGINDWLENPRESDFIDVTLPKFEITVSSQLQRVLAGMGMPSAFGPADFSRMTDAPVYIDKVRHKAFLEVNEQGTEAAAATEVDFLICFAAGTPVLTPDGEKPIEQLKAGDYVLSRNEHNLAGKIQHKLVEETFHGRSELVSVQVGGRVIRATPVHPFFVKDQGWTQAGELRRGDLLATDLCSWMEVEDISTSDEAEPVYNLRVSDHHTYFVGSESWGFAVWVHNSYGDEFRADRPFHFFIRDNASSVLLFMGRVNDPTQSENSLIPTVVQDIAGDFDGDGDVDAADRTILTQFWTGALPPGAGDRTFEQGDADGDGDVDSADATLLAQNWTGALMQARAAMGTELDYNDEPLTPVEADDFFDEKSTSDGVPISPIRLGFFLA